MSGNYSTKWLEVNPKGSAALALSLRGSGASLDAAARMPRCALPSLPC